MKLTKPLVVSMGEPAGIGPDIILMAYKQRAALGLPFFYVIGDFACLNARAAALGLNIPLSYLKSTDEVTDNFDKALPVFDIGPINDVAAGHINPLNETIVAAAIERSVEHIAKGWASGLVTAPIQKEALSDAGFMFPGHTEFLGSLAGQFFPEDKRSAQSPVMMLASDQLRVVPLTVHVPLRDVFDLICVSLIKNTVRTLSNDLGLRFRLENPRIAVTGLNPHAGEGGLLGCEEIDIIFPAIEALSAEGFRISGPLPADTAFHEEARQGYDVIVAMTHDQALIPIKTLDFDRGVNVTLGLPFIRTSPDHGTALSLAGTGSARPTSFTEALKMAARMVRCSNERA